MTHPRSLFRRRPHGQVPKYLPAAAELAKHVEPGQVREVEVHHDDWCGMWKGLACDCNPDVKLLPRPEEN